HADKEAHFSIQAGEQALRDGAYQEAVKFLSRGLDLGTQTLTSTQRAHLRRQVGEAHYGLGNLADSREHQYAALELLGYPQAKTPVQSVFTLSRETLRQIGYRVRPRWRYAKSKGAV